MASKTTKSENVADLYLMFKDHKNGNKTRPTATGCSSNTLGLSNAVAEVLEAVANTEPRRYNTISSEDMLARFHQCNKNIVTRKIAGDEARIRKLRCSTCKIMERVDCINTELHNWDEILNSTASKSRQEHQDLGEGQEQEVPKSQACQDNNDEINTNRVNKLLSQDCCSQEIHEELAKSCDTCGPGISEWNTKYSLVGSDVIALYPSIQSETTGKIIRERLENTKLEFEGFSQEKALAYIDMNKDLTTDLEDIAHLLPTRKSGKSSKLKISAIKQDWNPQEKYDFKNKVLSYQDKKKVIARVVEIATRALFQNHAYKFGNEFYKQEKGGSIGDRWTGCAAEIVMQTWAERYEAILTRSNIEVLLLSGYVDDGRQVTSTLPLGMRYDKKSGMFQFSKEAEIEDKNKKSNGESCNQRMARICQTVMNSINPDLEFTVETPEEFENEKLPTLDFKIWQEKDQTINHTYFQKAMKTPLVVMARSGMATNQKIQILSNELTRRLSNINKNNSTQEDHNLVIEQFTRELKNSGYHHRTAQEIIISGIRGHRTRIIRRTAKGQEFYRPAHKTVGSRTRKKLVSRENWYKEEKNEDKEQEPKIRTSNSWRTGTKRKREQEQENENKIKAVMFVPYTNGSELAKRLRENEENLNKITKNRIKIVERTGTKLQDLLTKSDPWKGSDCSRPNCLLCFTKQRTEKSQTQDCHKRNVVYETRCLTCQEEQEQEIENMDLEEQEKRELIKKIKLYKYVGETSRSSFERGWEHVNDMAQLKNSSHMLKHVLLNHKEQDMEHVKFGMKILRTCKSSFERQIYESVTIQQERLEHHVLNSRSEYNRCSLPRISAQIGEQDYEKYNTELKEEKLQEEQLEEMIRKIRKERNKARLRPSKVQDVGTKRRKINNEEYITIQEIWGKPTRTEPQKNKRTEENNENPPPKRTRTTMEEQHPQGQEQVNTKNTQNKNYTSKRNKQVILTNCKRIEDKVIEQEVDSSDLEWEEPRDWDKMLQERKERLEQEETMLNQRLELKKKKEQSWELYRTCKEYLEQNNDSWNKRKIKEQEERERLIRLEQARIKGSKIRQKQLENEQELRIKKLPREIQHQLEQEQAKEEQLELKRAKESLWKLRKQENKLENTQEVLAIKKLEKKNNKVQEILEKQKKVLMEQETRIRTTINKNNKKNNTKIDNTNKKKKLGEIWAMYRWITEYLSECTKEWELELDNYNKIENNKIQEWNRLNRGEKISTLKAEMSQDSAVPENVDQVNTTSWKIWKSKLVPVPEVQQTRNTENMEQEASTGTEKLNNETLEQQKEKSSIPKPPSLTPKSPLKPSSNQEISASPEPSPSKTPPSKRVPPALAGEKISVVPEITTNPEKHGPSTSNTTPRNTVKQHPDRTTKVQLKKNSTNTTSDENTTPGSRQKIQPTMNKFFTTKSDNKKQLTTKNIEGSPKNSPKNKKLISKNKKLEEEKTVKQLRGYWTEFARIQKEKQEMLQKRKITTSEVNDPIAGSSIDSTARPPGQIQNCQAVQLYSATAKSSAEESNSSECSRSIGIRISRFESKSNNTTRN